MSTSYYVDLGFDVNAAPTSNGNTDLVFTAGDQDLYTLQIGLVDHSAGGVPAWFTHFIYDPSTGAQDTLRFRIFDITDGINPSVARASGWTPVEFCLFTTTPGGSASTPFSPTSGTPLSGFPAGIEFGGSMLDKQTSFVDSPVFGPQTCWYVNQQDGDHGEQFRFDADGEFELSLSLTVEAPSEGTKDPERRIFSCDPRLYVGPNSWP